jgi:hypothetical protein
MTEGFYDDPRFPDVRPKIACIIPAYIPANKTKDYGYFIEDKSETIRLNLAAHKHFRPGVAYDIIVINHGGFSSEEVRVIDKPNEGYSFGAFKQAWEEFGEYYDFYLFAEDDIAPAKDDWLQEIVLKFFSAPDIGAVGNFVEARSLRERQSELLWELLSYEREMLYNLDGAFTFTSAKILRQVEKIGGLPVFDCEPRTKIPATINECAFQQPILELGYRMVAFDGFVVHGSEIFTNNLSSRTGQLSPLINVNGRFKIPEVAAIYKNL